jgi:hypothetical protein
VLVDDESIAASDVKTYDLPINPLSAVIITLKGLNATDEATLAEVLARLTKITVSRMGQTVYDISGADLYALNVVMFGHEPILTNIVATDNATRSITLVLPFGRKMYDPEECHPATRKGEFKLQITFSATETAIDGLILLVETVELLGASPKRYLKVTTLSDSASAAGEEDLDLPIGNVLAKILLFSTTVPTGTAWTTTVDWIKLMRNNTEHQIAKTKWEALHGELLRICGYIGDHSAAFGDDKIHKYGVLEFSPDGRDNFLVDTKGASSMKLRLYAGDTNEYRAIPIELVSV